MDEVVFLKWGKNWMDHDNKAGRYRRAIYRKAEGHEYWNIHVEIPVNDEEGEKILREVERIVENASPTMTARPLSVNKYGVVELEFKVRGSKVLAYRVPPIGQASASGGA